MSSGQNDASTELAHPRRVVPYHRGMIVSTLTRSRAFISQPARGALLGALVLSGVGCAQMLGLDSFLDASGSSGGAGGIPSSVTSTDGGGGGASTTTSEGGAGGTSAGGAGGAATSSSVGSGTGGAGGEGGDTTCGGADLLTDRDNCGTCGNVCPVGALSCSEGKCLQVTQLALSNFSSCALLSDGTARCWGSNEPGTLGDGTTVDRQRPVAVKDLSDIVELASGMGHVCARTTSGAVYCWGNNLSGQLGTSDAIDRIRPTEVPAWVDASRLALGAESTCAVLVDGSVSCLGDNGFGQLGDGTEVDSLMPVVTLAGPVVDLTASGYHTCARADAGVWCWGNNQYGQLGNGSTDATMIPVLVAGLDLANVAQIALGGSYSCAVLNGGNVRCWGQNEYSQLGIESSQSFLSAPGAAVANLGPTKSLALGNIHSCALLVDKSVSCWGDNQFGQLGNDTPNHTHVPVPVPGLADVVEIAAGGLHSCARIEDGRVLCWGNNNEGELGDGSTTGRATPAPVKW